MFYADVCESYLQWCKVERRLATTTLKTYAPWLRTYAKFCESSCPSPLTFGAAMAPLLIKRYLYDCSAKGWRPRTIRNAIIALRGLARFGLAQNYLAADPTLTLALPKPDPASRPIASDSDLTKLMEVVEFERNTRKRARERAMLYVLVMTGVRFSELLSLREQDVDLARATLKVQRGKGDKTRLLYPPPDCMSALAEWLIERRKMGVDYDYLWAYDIGRRMGEVGTRKMLEDLKARAGLAHVDAIKPHALRRAFATRMLRAGSDIKSIQAALGHTMATTTFIYLGMQDLPAQAMATTAALPAPNFARTSPRLAPLSPATPPSPTKHRAADLSRRRRTPAR